jgi:hypothetical protein
MDNNEQDEIKPETENEKRYRLKRELQESLNIYDINPRTIYSELRDKWEKYDKDLLYRAKEALHIAYGAKQVMTYFNDGTEWGKNRVSDYMKNLERLGNGEVFPTDDDGFPIPYYFLGGNYNDMEYIVCFDEPCLVEKDTWEFDFLFALQFSLTPIVECREFLTYQLKKSFNNNITEFADYLENICLEHKEFLAEKYETFCKKFIREMQTSKIETEETTIANKGNLSIITKLKWLGTPSQFSYIFLELAKNGFIEIPSTNGEASYSKYSKVCWDLFEFQNKTTLENLQKEMNPNKNTLSEGVRAKFTFPSLDDISKKIKK